MKLNRSNKSGFSLIELLTVIAIIGILAAILIPTVGRVRETARRTVDASNIRQIAQAALIFSNDFNGRLPGTNQTPITATGNGVGAVQTGGGTGSAVEIHAYAAALARYGGLNDANLWVSNSDEAALADPDNLTMTTVIESTAPTSTFAGTFGDSTVSFMAVSGLTTNRPSTTPVAFTRGLQSDGTWAPYDGSPPTAASGVYATDGGHIAFLGGNVTFYSRLEGPNQLAATDGSQTVNILETLLAPEAVIGNVGAPLAGSAGTGTPP